MFASVCVFPLWAVCTPDTHEPLFDSIQSTSPNTNSTNIVLVWSSGGSPTGTDIFRWEFSPPEDGELSTGATTAASVFTATTSTSISTTISFFIQEQCNSDPAFSATSSYTVVVDLDPPLTPLLAGSGLTNNPTPTWSWDSGGGSSDTPTFLYSLDDPNLSLNGIITTATSFTAASTLASTLHTFYLLELDAVGNLSPVSTFQTEVDTVPPGTPNLSGPVLTNNPTPTWSWGSGGGGSGTPTFIYSLGDSNLQENGITTLAVSFTANSELDSNIHTFYLVELDAAGNFSPVSSFSTVVDLDPPSPSIISGPTLTNDPTPTWSWASGGGSSPTPTFRYGLDDSDLSANGITTTAFSFTTTSTLASVVHTFYLVELDEAGNISELSAFETEVDTIPPSAPTLLGLSLTNDPILSWNWESTGGGQDPNLFIYSLDDADLINNGITTSAFDFTTSSYAPLDIHTFYLVELDAVGNPSPVSTFVTILDTAPPSTPILTGLTLTNDPTPTWSWSPGGGSSPTPTFRYALDDSDLEGSGVTTTAFSFTPDSDIPSGIHTFYLLELDAVSNLSPISTFETLVDLNPPNPPIINGITLTGDPKPTWSWASGGGGSGTPTFIYGLNNSDLEGSGITTTAFSFTTASTLASAIHTFFLVELDEAGNASSVSTFATEVDTDPPSIPNLTGLTLSNDPTPTWSWTSGGGSSATPTFIYSLDNADLATAGITTTAFNFTPAVGLSEEIHTFYIVEVDAVNNISPASSFGTQLDFTAPSPPTVSGTSPINTNTPTWLIAQGGGDGINIFRVKLDDSNMESETTTVTNNVFEAGVLSDGIHVLYVQERDTAENWSSTSSHPIEIDTTGPNPPLLVGVTQNQDGIPRWEWSSGGGGGNGNFQFELYNASAEVIFSATSTTVTEYSTDLTIFGNVFYQFDVKEYDDLGNLSEVSSLQTTVNTNLPVAPSVTGPSSPTSNSEVTWSWFSNNNKTDFIYNLNQDVEYTDEVGHFDGIYVSNSTTSFQLTTTLSDGFHTIFVADATGVDPDLQVASDLSATGFYQVEVDTVGPAIPIVSVVGENPTSALQPSFSWVSGGNGGIGIYRFQVDDEELSAPGEGEVTSYELDFDLDEGEHILYVQERDLAGNWSESGTGIVTIDLSVIAPSIVVTSPTKDQTPEICWSSDPVGDGNGNFRWELSPPGDGDLEAGADFSGTDTCFTTGIDLPEGAYDFFIQEQDDLGNWSEVANTEIVIDLTGPGAPTVSATSPISTTNAVWTWEGDSGEGSGIFRYKFNDPSLDFGATSTTSLSFTTSVSFTDNITYTLYVQESDVAGNWSSTGSADILVDFTAPASPSVTAESPTSNPFPEFTWIFQGGGNGLVRFELSPPGDDDLSTDSTEAETNNFTTTEALADGTYIFYVQESDDAGNWSTSGSVIVTIDTFVPSPISLSVTSPTSNVTPIISWASGGEDGNGNYRFELSPPGDDDLGTSAIATTSTTFQTGIALPDGEYSFYVQEQDSLGNWSVSSSVLLTIDTTGPLAPSVSGVSPVSTPNPTWTWLKGDPADGAGVFRFKFNDPSFASGSISTVALSFTTPNPLTDGTYTLYVQEQDDLGNWSASGNASVEVDLTPPAAPSVSVISPTSDNTPTFTWVGGGGGLGNFRFKLDDSSLESGSSLTSATSFAPLGSLLDGEHILYVQESDAAGNWSSSGSVLVTVDTFVPAPVSLAVDSPTSDTTPIFTWASGGFDGNGAFRYELVPPGDGDLNGGSETVVGTSFETSTALSDGVYTLHIQEQDALGNWSSSSTISVTVDTEAPGSPSVTGITPTSFDRPTWSWTSGGGGDSYYRFNFNEDSFVSGFVSTTALSFTTSTTLGEGTYTLYVQESDLAGNWSTSGSFSIAVDKTPPNTPSVFATTSRSNPLVTWGWSSGGLGAGTFRFKLDNDDLSTGTTVSSSSGYTETLALADGEHTLFVQEVDDVGNWSASGSFTLTVDTTAPPMPVVSGPLVSPTAMPTWTWTGDSGGDPFTDGVGVFRYSLDLDSFDGSELETISLSFTPSSSLSEGHHILYVQERDDAYNWSVSGSFTLTVDADIPPPPSVSGIPLTSSTSPTWTWVGDPGVDGTGTFRYKLDDDSLESGATTTTSTSFTASNLNHGEHILYVQEQDLASNWSLSGSFLTTIDIIPPSAPSVAGISPTSDKTPTWTWTGDQNGDGVGEFRFRFNDPSLESGAISTDATSFTTELVLIDGIYTLYVQERDFIGNWSSSGSASLTVDTVGPSAPGIIGSTITSYTSPIWYLEGDSAGGIGIYRLDLVINGLICDPSKQTYVITSTVFQVPSNLVDGTYELCAQERDQAGNWSDQNSFITEIDTSIPGTPLVFGDLYTQDLRPSWNWDSAGGGNGVFRISLNDENFTNPELLSAYTYTSSEDLAEGEYTLFVQERNAAGTWSASGSFKVIIDRTAPQSPLVSSLFSTTVDRQPQWDWLAQGGGIGIFRYKLGDENFDELGIITTANSFSPLFPFVDGKYKLYVQERDESENWSESGFFEVEIDGTAPSPPLVTAQTPQATSKPVWNWISGGGGNGQYRFRIDNSNLSSGSTETTLTSYEESFGLDDGNHTLYVQERDEVGNWSATGSFTILVNTGFPNAPSVSGPEFSIDGFPTFHWTTRGGGGNGTFRFLIDSPDLENGAQETTSLSFTLTTQLSEGEHTFYVQEQNNNGDWSVPGFFTTLVDFSAPDSPSVTGTRITSSRYPTWTWESGSGGSGVFRFELDDGDLSSGALVTTSKSFQPNEELEDGFHVLYVQERDLSGNWSESGFFETEVDTSAPTNPIVSSISLPDSPKPSWTWISGGGGNGNFRFKLDSEDLSSGSIMTSALEFEEPIGLNDGLHTLYVQESDDAGNWSGSGRFEISINTGAPNHPIVNGHSPTNDIFPQWSWLSGGAGGNGNYRYLLDSLDLSGEGIQTVSTSFIPLESLADGMHTLYVQEQNTQGQWSVPGFFKIIVDTISPEAPIVSGPELTNDLRPTFSWITGANANGSGIFRYQFDSEAFEPTMPVTSQTEFKPNIDLSEGIHVLYVQERDEAGNWSLSGQLKFEIDLTPPRPPTITLSSVTSDPNPFFTWVSGGTGNGLFRIKMDDPDLEKGAVELRDQGFFQSQGLSNGEHTIYVQERDEAGNWSSSGLLTFFIETLAPSPPRVSAQTPVNNPKPLWSWKTGREGEGTGVYRVSIDNNLFDVSSITVNGTEFVPTQNLSDGFHTLYVQESNIDGIWSASGFFTLEIDTTPPIAPSVRVDSPTSSPELSAYITPEDSSTVQYRYELNGAVFDSNSEITDSTSIVIIHGQEDGQFPLAVQAGDLAGNWSDEGTAFFEVDTTPPAPPSVSGTTPTSSNKPVWVWIAGGDGMGIFRYGLDEGEFSVTSKTSFTPLLDLNDGIYTLYVQERDLAGNWSASASFAIEVDSGAPNSPIVTGPPASNQARPKWTWISDADDGSGIFRYRLDNPNLEVSAVETSAKEFTPNDDLSEGRHTLYVQERNNLGIWSVAGFYALEIDTAAPLPPSVDGTTPTSDVTPTWFWTSSGGGAGQYRFKLDDDDLSSGSTQTTSQFFTAPSLEDGAHTLYVQESDIAGNYSDAGFFTITIDTVPPSAPSVISTAVSTSPNPIWTWTPGGGGNGKFRYKLDDSDLTSGAKVTPLTYFQESFGLNDGTYTLFVQERDVVGNWSDSGSFSLLVQTNLANSPSISAQTPTSLTRPLWQWEAVGDKGNRTFRYKLDNDDLDSSGSKITIATSFSPAINLSEGDHTLYVQEQNDDGEWGIRGFFTLRVDTTPPSPPKISGVQQTNNTRPAWSWIPSGETNEVYRYKLETIDGEDLLGGLIQTTSRSFVPSLPLPEGTYRLFVEQQDLAGNWSEASFLFITINLSVPNAPSVEASFAVTNDSTPQWVWSSLDIDGSGIYRISFDNFISSNFLTIQLPDGQFSTKYSPAEPLGDGVFRLFVREQNIYGTFSKSNSAEILVDTLAPITSIEPLPGFHNKELDLKLICDDGDGSGCLSSFLTTSTTLSDLFTSPLTSSLHLSSSATATFFTMDSAGNAETIQFATYILDFQKPVVRAVPGGGVHKLGQQISLICEDAIGCEWIRFSKNGAPLTTTSAVFNAPFTLNEDFIISFFAKDLAGNLAAIQSLSYSFDATSPVVIPSVGSGSYDFGFVAELVCNDDRTAPCQAIHYSVDGSEPTTNSPEYEDEIGIPIREDTELRFFGIDAVGNIGQMGIVSYGVPRFGFTTSDLYVGSGESITITVDGANQPSFNLNKNGLGTLLSQANASVTFRASTVNRDEILTLSATETIAGEQVSSSVRIHILERLSIADSEGVLLAQTTKLGSKAYEIRASGGSGNYRIRQISGPGPDLVIVETGVGIFQIKPPQRGAFAGTYSLRLEDPVSGFQKEFDLQVGFRLVVPRVNLLQETSTSLRVLGGLPDEIFKAKILRSSSLKVASSNEGFQSVGSAVATDDVSSANEAIFSLLPIATSRITSYVIDVTSEQRKDLGSVRSPIFHIFPSKKFEGSIRNIRGENIPGVRIRTEKLRNSSGSFYSGFVESDGNFSIILPLNPSEKYNFVIEAPGYIPLALRGSDFQFFNNRNTATIRLQKAGFLAKVEVQGMETGEEIEIFAVELNSLGNEVASDPFFFTLGESNFIDLPLANLRKYVKITARSQDYLSAVTAFKSGDQIHSLRMIKPKLINITESLNQFGNIIFHIEGQGLDLSNYDVEVRNSSGQLLIFKRAVASNGLDIEVSIDQNLLLYLKSPQGVIEAVWNHSIQSIGPGLPGGLRQLLVGGGFQSRFEADENLLDNPFQEVQINLPPGGVNENLIDGDLDHSSIQVNAIELPQSNLAADGLGQNIFEVQLNLLKNTGERVDLDVGNKILSNLEITLPFDPQVVLPGDLESGKYKIWFSEDASKFNSLDLEAVPKEDLQEIDYINNRITFRVNHLTAFGIGSFQPTLPSPTQGNTPVSSCFIATAAFGDAQNSNVQSLTRFRDDFLTQTDMGRSFVEMYYIYSPILAEKISQSPLLSKIISWILYPIVLATLIFYLNGFGWFLLSLVFLVGVLLAKNSLKTQ